MSGWTARWDQFWHEFALERSRIAVLRLGLLGLLAWDLWTTFLAHAARYGAGGFNVTQARWLDGIAPLPTPAVVGVAWLFAGFMAARAAIGVATRRSTAVAAFIYIGLYVWGQADSYQHHYFICLLLGILVCLPDDAPTTEDGRSVKHWTLRAFYVQLTFLYLWTAVTKSDPVWLGGTTLEQIVAKPALRADVLALGARFGLDESNVFPVMAVGVMLGQYFAAIVVQIRRLWWLGLLVIPWFHVFVEFIEFDIEYFSYYMIALLGVLLTPPPIWGWGEARVQAAAGWIFARLKPLRGPTAASLAVRGGLAALAGAGAAAIAAQVRVEGTPVLTALVGAASAAGVWWARPGRSLVWVVAAQVGLAGLMLFSLRATGAEYDYYRLWGGDLKRRGEVAEAILRYQQANAATDGPARFYQLGQLLARDGRDAEALAAYQTSRARQEAALEAERRAVNQQTTDGERRFDLGERHLRIRSRCTALASAYARAGQSDAASEARGCAEQNARSAVDAFEAGLKLLPQSARGHRGLRDAQKGVSGR